MTLVEATYDHSLEPCWWQCRETKRRDVPKQAVHKNDNLMMLVFMQDAPITRDRLSAHFQLLMVQIVVPLPWRPGVEPSITPQQALFFLDRLSTHSGGGPAGCPRFPQYTSPYSSSSCSPAGTATTLVAVTMERTPSRYLCLATVNPNDKRTKTTATVREVFKELLKTRLECPSCALLHEKVKSFPHPGLD